MADNNSISTEDIQRKLFITQNFINDCKDPSATLTLFYAIFTSPYYVADNGDKTPHPSEDIPVRYTEAWGRQWRSTDNVQSVLVCEMPNSVRGDFVEGGFLKSTTTYLAVNFDTTHKQLKVKIPFFQGINSQTCGILKYCKDDTDVLQDAFIFNTRALNVGVIGFRLNNEPVVGATGVEDNPWNVIEGYDDPGVYQFSPETLSPETRAKIKTAEVNNNNNDSVIYIDLSKLNIAATLKSAYTKVKSGETSQEYYTSGWYTDEHLHNLFAVQDRNNTLETLDITAQNNFGNIGSFTHDILGKTEVISTFLNPNLKNQVVNDQSKETGSNTDPEVTPLEVLVLDSLGRLYTTSIFREGSISSMPSEDQAINIVKRNLGSVSQQLPPTSDLPISYDDPQTTEIYEDLKLMYLTQTYADPESASAAMPIDINEIYEL